MGGAGVHGGGCVARPFPSQRGRVSVIRTIHEQTGGTRKPGASSHLRSPLPLCRRRRWWWAKPGGLSLLERPRSNWRRRRWWWWWWFRIRHVDVSFFVVSCPSPLHSRSSAQEEAAVDGTPASLPVLLWMAVAEAVLDWVPVLNHSW